MKNPSVSSTSTNIIDVPLPSPWPDANKRLLLGHGAPIEPIRRLGTFSPDEFENFVHQWVHEYLAFQYIEVNKQGGAGDKGRDIIAWIDSKDKTPRRWDNYQCKHYKDPLAPSNFWVELGKMCFYSFQGDYSLPEKYFIVTHKGIGPTLTDLLDNPIKLREELIQNWPTHCQNKITKTKSVILDKKLNAYIKSIDFSFVQSISPQKLLEQHSFTKYHSIIFGTSLKPRPKPAPPPVTIATHETRYVEQIFEAFADHLKCPINNPLDFKQHNHLIKHFNHARICFYSAESLKEFSRDNLPDENYFIDLMEEFLDGLIFTLLKKHADGYEKMIEIGEKVGTLQIDSNVLRDDLLQKDRVGICHHLANEDKLHWVMK